MHSPCRGDAFASVENLLKANDEKIPTGRPDEDEDEEEEDIPFLLAGASLVRTHILGRKAFFSA